MTQEIQFVDMINPTIPLQGAKRLQHSVSGTVKLPMPSSRRRILLAQWKKNAERPQGYDISVYEARNVIANDPYSRTNINGRTTWILSNIDDGVTISTVGNNRDLADAVSNGNPAVLNLTDAERGFNALQIGSGRLANFPVAPNGNIAQAEFEAMNALALDILTLNKGLEAIEVGDVYTDYRAGRAKQASQAMSVAGLLEQKLVEYQAEQKRLLEEGKLMTTSGIFVPANELNASSVVIVGHEYKKNHAGDNYLSNPVAYGRRPTYSLRVYGEGKLDSSKTFDKRNPNFQYGLQETDGGVRYTRREVVFTANNGEAVKTRVTVFDTNNKRAERFEDVIIQGNTVIELKDDNILTFESMYNREETDTSWITVPRINVGNYSVPNTYEVGPVEVLEEGEEGLDLNQSTDTEGVALEDNITAPEQKASASAPAQSGGEEKEDDGLPF